MPISGVEIKSLMKSGKLAINPILDEEEQIQTAKVDLRLDNVFYRIKSEQSTHRDTLYNVYDHLDEITIPFSDVTNRPGPESLDEELANVENGFVLHPDEFALAQTLEYVDLPNNLRGLLTGRSSMGREGVIVHSTASVIDPGYTGDITFELSTIGNLPVILYPRQRIASIEFERVEGELPEEQRESRFGDVRHPEPSVKEIEDEEILSIRI